MPGRAPPPARAVARFATRIGLAAQLRTLHGGPRPIMSTRACTVAAEYIERNAEALVASWILWLRDRVDTSTVNALPERALRNHVPPVLASLARFLHNPLELAREELYGHLRLHGQIRRDQGYSLTEVLGEFEGLADLVTRGVTRALETDAADAPATDHLEAATRLATGLRAISIATVGTFSASDEERANELAGSLEEFARAVSHEFRNPLNTLSLTVQLLRKGTVPADSLDDHLSIMEGAVARATALMDTVHTLAVAEGARAGGRLALLEDAVRRVVADFADDAHAAKVAVEVEHPLPAVRIEGMPLYIVLANVIGNAIKYHDRQKPHRWVRVSASVIEEEHDSGFCEVRIEDNGIGIPSELLPRVMQKGFRAHPEHAQGTGLGLHIAHRTATTRGGSIEIESEEGQRTNVVVRLRCLAADDDAACHLSIRRLIRDTVLPALTGSEPAALPDDDAIGASGEDQTPHRDVR